MSHAAPQQSQIAFTHEGRPFTQETVEAAVEIAVKKLTGPPQTEEQFYSILHAVRTDAMVTLNEQLPQNRRSLSTNQDAMSLIIKTARTRLTH